MGIMINLLIQDQYFDIALRDLGLAIGAFALGQLASQHEHIEETSSGRIYRHHPRVEI